MAKSNEKTHYKRMDNCHIPKLVQAFSNVENRGLNRVHSAKPLNLYDSPVKFLYIYNEASTNHQLTTKNQHLVA